ncbi:hypothetical protein [Pontiella agarivorans]|uniref:Uncharacterized protein n=1 Tax=Pontiella agarivorans TaxID=3038953 RepID=A0ABU5MZB6_9BACT|nr:hypothetical protein [Pontiella agarivorans]MDZ8119522.1 hypothetical protein [Pontiella agarivorans]
MKCMMHSLYTASGFLQRKISMPIVVFQFDISALKITVGEIGIRIKLEYL